MGSTKLAQILGWTGIGIGIAEILAPRWVEGILGIEQHGPLLKTMGAREIAAGIGIVSQGQPTRTLQASVWSRVAGDALDLALLALAARKTRNAAGLSTATAMVLGVTAMDIFCAMKLQSDSAE